MTLYENRPKWYKYILGILMPLVMITVLSYVMHNREKIAELNPGKFDKGEGFSIFIDYGIPIMMAVSAFLMIAFTVQMIKNPSIFTISDEGFVYNPAGVSSGLILWSDIIEIRETDVIVKRGNKNTGTEKVFAVILKNPDQYIQQKSAALRPLLRLRLKMSNTPLILNIADLGKNPGDVIAILKKFVPIIPIG
ncbi:MAG: hypothetical protein FGM46_07865 [Ferruginibacter sp.]|nr:hypothetical protein [Ferruginibacter sp.]